MSCLGVHFSFPAAQGGSLWDGDEAARAFVAELEERWDTYYLQETDKAWDAIHRCLSDGTLVWDAGRWPLRGAILGRMVPRPAPRAARPRVRGRRRPGRLRLHLVLVRTDARVLPQDRRRRARCSSPRTSDTVVPED